MAARELQIPSRFKKAIDEGQSFDGWTEENVIRWFNGNRPVGAEEITCAGQLPRLMKEQGWRFAAKAVEPKPAESGSTEATPTPKPAKKANGKAYIPSRVSGWLEGRSGVEIPPELSLSPEQFWVLVEKLNESDPLWWPRQVSRLGAEEIAPLRAFAGRPLTEAMAEQEEIESAHAARVAAWDRIQAIRAELLELNRRFPELTWRE